MSSESVFDMRQITLLILFFYRYIEYNEMEVNFLNIQLQQQSNGHKKYIPINGLQIRDLNICWRKLEHAEHQRDVLIRQELLRYI